MTKEQFNLEMERIAAMDWSITTTAATQVMFCARYIESLEAENAFNKVCTKLMALGFESDSFN